MNLKQKVRIFSSKKSPEWIFVGIFPLLVSSKQDSGYVGSNSHILKVHVERTCPRVRGGVPGNEEEVHPHGLQGEEEDLGVGKNPDLRVRHDKGEGPGSSDAP